MAFKCTFTEPVPEQRERVCAEKGIDTYRGRAQFTGSNTLEVDGKSLAATQILIASGAEPVKLEIPGEEYLITSEEFLELESLPKKIVLVGGGYIAAEFSHIAARAGAQVTILQHGKQILKHFDPELVDWLMGSFERIGIDVHTQANVDAIEKTDHGYRVRASRDGTSIMEIDADCTIHAAGRVPALGSLNLAAANIAVEQGKLKLNAYLQSISNPAVYAAGDAAQMGPPLTPVSSHDGKVVAANILEGNNQKPDYRGVPSVAFTIPPSPQWGSMRSRLMIRGSISR
jgi:glutathione reductase (NADPH)